MDHKTKISRAKIKCMTKYPFFGSVLLKLPVIADETVGTMCTNGRNIKYGPEFVNKITEDEVIGVLIHEVYHVIFKHHLRMGSRNPEKWNIAADYVINNNLLDMGLSLPEGGLWDVEYKDKYVEDVYNLLPPHIHECPWGSVVQLCDEQGKPLQGEALEEAKAEIDKMVASAADLVKKKGDIPADIKRLLNDIRKPKVDWRNYLNGHFKSLHPDDYTWSRPNRKFIQHVYLPTMYGTTIGDLAVAIDTSGSLDDEQLSQFLGEINMISAELKPEKITVIYCDADVQGVEVFTNGDEITQLNAKGGGGTRVSPVFEYIEEQGIEPETLLYFTDMYWNDCPKDDPGYPTIWCATERDERCWGDTHFGTSIYIDVD